MDLFPDSVELGRGFSAKCFDLSAPPYYGQNSFYARPTDNDPPSWCGSFHPCGFLCEQCVPFDPNVPTFLPPHRKNRCRSTEEKFVQTGSAPAENSPIFHAAIGKIQTSKLRQCRRCEKSI